MPASAGGPQPAPQDQWTLRDFTGGTASERLEGRNFEHEPLLAVLTPHLAGPEAEIRAGQALQRLLLTATVHGLAASFLFQLIEVTPAREQLRRLISATRTPMGMG